MLSDISSRINEHPSPLPPLEILPVVWRVERKCESQKQVEFQQRFLYIWRVMNKKYFEKVILSHPKDNVATAKSPISIGTLLMFSKTKKIVAKEQIPFAHKIALRRISKDGAVVKYGERIGRAIREIKSGELVHIHNVVGERGRSKGRKKG